MPQKSILQFRAIGLALSLSVLLPIIAPRLSAQIDTGRIVGTVQSGGVVPGANLVLTNEDTQLVLTTTSRSTGTYVFTGLKVGAYTLKVEMQGFQTFIRQGLPVHLQKDLTVDVALVPGQLSQTVTITATVPLLQAEDASLGQTVGAREVDDLPLNGRNWIALSQTSAGVSTVQGGSAGDASFTANGVSYWQNDFRLNGINNNNEVYNFSG